MHIAGFLEVNQFAHVIFLRESTDEFGLVLVKTPREIVGDPDVKDSLVPVTQKINVIAIFHDDSEMKSKKDFSLRSK
jgi:hypothetical protein